MIIIIIFTNFILIYIYYCQNFYLLFNNPFNLIQYLKGGIQSSKLNMKGEIFSIFSREHGLLRLSH
jgi:hypothetical protein